jgi:elongator complex protein 3
MVYLISNSCYMSFYLEIYDYILRNDILSKKQLQNLKIKLSKKYNLKKIPKNSDIITHIPASFSELDKSRLIQILQRKPMRTMSGVAIIAVMTSPTICPHGSCIPCPGGPMYDSPQSYTGFEPAAMRAKLNDFDPYRQVQTRINQLTSIGHPTDKIDFIIMGGTFTARDPYYRSWFVKRCYDALNNTTAASLDDAMKQNETGLHRCIGLTVETRPDWFGLQHVDNALSFGTTRVELGVQSIYDDVLQQIRRGHTVIDTINATRIAKDTGLKVCYHMMPGLPGSNNKKDINAFKTIFSDEHFKPDMIKIYPTLVVKGTALYDLWKKGDYQPLSTQEAADMIVTITSFLPEWIRVQRIQRDIPAQYIDDGVMKSNLRQLVEDELDEQGKQNSDIRAREIGHMKNKNMIELDEVDITLRTIEYNASGGKEVFISLNTIPYDALVGYLRLREITHSHRFELADKKCMMIRELKVVGKELSIGDQSSDAWQHKGFGSRLLEEAIRLSQEEFDSKWLYVLSGVGVKEYYRKYHDFHDDGIYLKKQIIT